MGDVCFCVWELKEMEERMRTHARAERASVIAGENGAAIFLTLQARSGTEISLILLHWSGGSKAYSFHTPVKAKTRKPLSKPPRLKVF